MRRALVTVLLLMPVEAAQAESQLKIVFTSFMHVDQVPELSEVYMMDPDGSNTVRLTHTDGGGERWPTPGPDGTLLYWSDDQRRMTHSNPGDVFKMDLHTRQVTQVTPGSGSWNGACLSPDGGRARCISRMGKPFPGTLDCAGSEQRRLDAFVVGLYLSPMGGLVSWRSRPGIYLPDRMAVVVP